MEVLKNYILNDKDFKKVYENRHDSKKEDSMEETVNALMDYIFYSEFNPYMDKEYVDCSYLKDDITGVIYNLDDIYILSIKTS